jgi:hypothetical protein
VVEENLIQGGVEQFSHAGQTPFGKELVHTGDSPMADDIYEGILEREVLSDPTIQAIVDPLKKFQLLDNIIKLVVMAGDFKSAFKCVHEKATSSPSGRGVHHYKSCTEVSFGGLSDIMCE